MADSSCSSIRTSLGEPNLSALVSDVRIAVPEHRRPKRLRRLYRQRDVRIERRAAAVPSELERLDLRVRNFGLQGNGSVWLMQPVSPPQGNQIVVQPANPSQQGQIQVQPQTPGLQIWININ